MGGTAGNFGGTQGNPTAEIKADPQGASQTALVPQPPYTPYPSSFGSAGDYSLSPLQAQSPFMRNPMQTPPPSMQQGIYNPQSANSYMNPYGIYGGFNPYGGGIMGLLGNMGGYGMYGGGFGGYNPYRFY